MKRPRRQIYREHQISEQYLTMDFRSEASSWAIHNLAGDIFGVCLDCNTPDNGYPRSIAPQDSPAGCAESSWERAPDARVLECVCP